jgi:hypothetical protein
MRKAYLHSMAVSAVVGAGLVASCGGSTSKEFTANLGEVSLAVLQVPADTGCIEIKVVGARTVDRFFDVTPGQTSTLRLSGLPVGNVTITGNAFTGACASVSSMSNPVWVSDPTPAVLVAGVPVDLTITLHHNGIGNIGVDFADDDGGAAPPVDSGPPACPTGQTSCGGTCVDLSTNPSNCGTCGHACVSGSSCVSGACVCPAGQTFCGVACVNTQTSKQNCGGCGIVCPGNQNCAAGACVCPTGTIDCNGDGTCLTPTQCNAGCFLPPPCP